MNIAIVTNVLPPEGRGGAEAYAALEARTFAGEHDVVVISGSRDGDVGDAAVVPVPALPQLDHDAPLQEKLVWHARDQWRPAVHRAVLQTLRDRSPDVVHTHSVQGLSAGVFTAIAAAGVPHVHTAHDQNLLCVRTSMTRDAQFCGGRCPECRLQRAIRGHAARRGLDQFVAVSEYILRQHIAAGVATRERSIVLRLGAPAASARVRQPEDGRLRVGFIGALAVHKGVRTLLAAFEDAPEGWELVVAGAGPLEPEVVAAAGRSPHITFLGHISGDSKERFYDGIDILAIPSEWEEPAALVGTEAAVRGIPSIVSNRGGIPELPEARVFRARNLGALQAGLSWFADDPSRVERASRRLVELHDELSWETHVSRLEAILRRAVAGRRSA